MAFLGSEVINVKECFLIYGVSALGRLLTVVNANDKSSVHQT